MPVASTDTSSSPRPKPSSTSAAAARNVSSNENKDSLIDTLFGSGGDGVPSSVTKQMIFGGVSGWVTGFLAMKVGKAVAIAVGGGIIILQIANHQGYININWSRLQRDVDNVTTKLADGDKKKNWSNKLDRKLEQVAGRAEDFFDSAESRSRRWYNKMLGRESRDLHVFLTSFSVGTAIGILIGS